MLSKSKIFAIILISLLVEIVFSQPIFNKKYSNGYDYKSLFLQDVVELSDDDYLGIVNSVTWGDYKQFWLWRFNSTGDTLWTKVFNPRSGGGFRKSSIWGIRLIKANDNEFHILFGERIEYEYFSYHCNGIMKINLNGDIHWSRIISPEDPWAASNYYDIVLTGDNGVAAVGATSFLPSKASIVKLNSSGSLDFSGIIFDEYNTSAFYSVGISSDGKILATGDASNINYQYKLIAAKVDLNGQMIWKKSYYSGDISVGDRRLASGLSLVSTIDGGCFITGYVTRPGETSLGSALIMKLNMNGDSIFTREYVGTERGRGYTIKKTVDNNFLVLCNTNHGYTSGTYELLKINSAGDSLWSQAGYFYNTYFRNISSDGGNLFVGVNWDEGWAFTFFKSTSGGVFRNPELRSPYNNYTYSPDSIEFRWWWCHRNYELQIATDSSFTQNVISKIILEDNTYIKNLLANQKYYWHVRAIGFEGSPGPWSDVWSFNTSNYTSAEEKPMNVPDEFILYQNFPNPLNPATTINFGLPKECNVTLKVYNITGQEVMTLINNEKLSGGYHFVKLDGSRLTSGVYIYKIIAGDYLATKKMILIK